MIFRELKSFEKLWGTEDEVDTIRKKRALGDHSWWLAFLERQMTKSVYQLLRKNGKGMN